MSISHKERREREKAHSRPAETATSARRHALTFAFLLLPFAFFASACRQDMHDQPKYIPMRSSAFFDDETSARQPVEGTVARGQLREDEHLYTGKTGQQFAATFPFEITKEALDRGQEQYNVFCSVCHDRTGAGNGMIVQRGFRRPPSFHIDRLRQAPPGHFFDVISNGFGAMSDYSAQITPEDRWKVIAYIRALQLSQNATIEDVPPQERDKLNQGGQTR